MGSPAWRAAASLAGPAATLVVLVLLAVGLGVYGAVGAQGALFPALAMLAFLQATALILELCGGEPSELKVSGQAPAPPAAIAFDRSYVKKLSGLDVGAARIDAILTALGFTVEGDTVTPPSWRRDVEGKADLVEEVARIEGFDNLPEEPLPPIARPAGGVLTIRQRRMRVPWR